MSTGSLVQFPVRVYDWIAGQVPSRGHVKSFLKNYLTGDILPTHGKNFSTVCRQIILGRTECGQFFIHRVLKKT